MLLLWYILRKVVLSVLHKTYLYPRARHLTPTAPDEIAVAFHDCYMNVINVHVKVRQSFLSPLCGNGFQKAR